MTGLVLGRSGQVASHLRSLLVDAEYWGRPDYDLRDAKRLEKSIVNFAPDYVINAAAYTAVDKAETERDFAWQTNVDGARAAAAATRTLNIPFVHFSTDYVFDGTASSPYAPSSPTHAINVYGLTKLAGELGIQVCANRYWILRTSWVFSEHGNNFVKTMINLARTRNQLSIVDDQRGVPTYAGDLAKVAATLVDNSDVDKIPTGTYHAVGGPIVSWHEFAAKFLSMAADRGLIDQMPMISPIPSSQFPTAARRPMYSVLQPSPEISSMLGHTLSWEAGIEQMLDQLVDMPTT